MHVNWSEEKAGHYRVSQKVDVEGTCRLEREGYYMASKKEDVEIAAT